MLANGAILLLQNSCVSSINGFLTSPYTGWLPVVAIVAIAIIAILAIMYALSPLMGRTDIKGWSRSKIYEVLVSLILVMIFAAFSTLLCTVNPEPVLNYVGLVPSSPTSPVSCTGSTTLTQVALCDINDFTYSTINTVNNDVFAIAVIASIVPDLQFSVNFIPGVQDLGISGALEFSPPIIARTMGMLLEGISIGMVINEVQLQLIGSSIFIFAVLMAIGLIARVFGVTKTFGSAAIAFALGLGFVYPLLVSVTYGFINNALAVASLNFSTALLISAFVAILLPIIVAIASMLGGAALAVNTIINAISAPFYWFIIYIGLAGLGLFFIPFINFIVTDIFIIDFSTAIGERIDLMSMLTSIV